MQDDAATMRAAALNATAQQGPAALEQAHGYRRTDEGALAISEADGLVLHALILERVLCRRDRAFSRADDLRKQLRDGGVAVDDKDMTYRFLPRAPTTHDYVRQDDGAVTINPNDQAQLDGLLFERMMAKKKRDYDAADRVQDLLKGAGVYVDDRTRTYEIRVPRPKREELPEKVYARSIEDDSNIALAPHDYEQLVARLQARQRAVRHRDWSSARAIRDELDAVAGQCGCRLVLDDDAGTFRFSTSKAKAPRHRDDEITHEYTREEEGCSRDDGEAIDALLTARVRAKRCRDFGRADELRDELRALGVFVDDRRRTFYCKPKPSLEAPQSPQIWDNLKPKTDRFGIGAGAGRYGAVPPPATGPVAFVAAAAAPDTAPGAGLFAAQPPPLFAAPPAPPPVPRADNGFPDF